MKTYWRAVTLAVEQLTVFPLVSSREFFYFTNVLLGWHFTGKIKPMFSLQDFCSAICCCVISHPQT